MRRSRRAFKSRLAIEKVATLLKVNVDTKEGTVQLNGSVDSERTKQRATELARQVDGVRKHLGNSRFSLPCRARPPSTPTAMRVMRRAGGARASSRRRGAPTGHPVRARGRARCRRGTPRAGLRARPRSR